MANTNETVTVRLIVAADGALRTLDQFDSAMTESANASVKAGAAVDAMTAHLARMRAAQEAGIPVLKARTAAMSVEERMLNSALGRADAMARARINAERDVSRAVASASNLVIQGKMSEADAIQAVIAVEQAHVAQINKMITAQRAAADAAQASGTAVRQSAGAIQAYNQSASRNSFESANIAMQFQDIAVSAQMGMSPMMVALQQGTQLSAIFNQMRNPLQALPAAFMSIINPVSLVTIALVGLTTAAIQWGVSALTANEDAASALEEHDKWLDQILVGYKSVRDAAKQAGEEALKLPREAVVSNTSAKAAEDAEKYRKSLERVDQAQKDLNYNVERWSQFQAEAARMYPDDPVRQDRFQGLIDMAKELTAIRVDANSTTEEVNAFISRVTVLMNEASDPALRDMAASLVELGNATLDFRSIADSSAASAANMLASMNDVPDEYGYKMEEWSLVTRDLASWHDELDAAARRAAAGIQTSYAAALQAAQGYGQAAGAANVYAGSLSRLQALIPAVAAAQQAQNQLAAAQIEYDKGVKALQEQQAQGLARDVYQERLSALTTTYDQARDAVSGLTAVQEEQDRLTRQNGIDALTGREQALARVNEQYRQQEEAIRALTKTGASQAEVDRLLAQNEANRNAALGNAGTTFDNKGGKGGGASRRGGSWDQSFQQRMESLQQEIALVGQSTFEIERQKTAFDLLNQAKQANVAITPELTSQINDMAASYAAATVELERMQEIQEFGKQVTDTLASGFKDLFKGLITGTKSANDAIADLLGRLGDLFLDRAFNMLFSGFGMGGGIGMGGGGLFGGMIIPGILHNGGVAGANGYGHGKAYSPAVWANATRYHTGGIAGLKPDEVPAILQRGERVIPRNAATSASSAPSAPSVVEIRLEEGLTANIVAQATNQAVKVTKGMVEPVSRAVDQMAQQQRYG